MSNDIVEAFEAFKNAHRLASDSLEQGTKKPAEVRKLLVSEAAPAFKQLDEKTRKAFVDSLLSNPLLPEITDVQAHQALERSDLTILLPLELASMKAYVRHVRKRGLGAAAEAANVSLVA